MSTQSTDSLRFDDPHTAMTQDAEVTRVRALRGPWRWLLMASALVTILLCINQQFTLRFFVGFTPLNTEYYYALVLVTLPFVFLVFPSGEKASYDRVPWYDALLFLITAAVAFYLMMHVRQAAEQGWEYSGAPRGVVWAGYVMWAVLMEGLRRTGGWSLLLCILPFTLYPVFADSAWLGPLKGQDVHHGAGERLPHAVLREPAGHPAAGLRRDRHRLPGVRHRADDDRRRQVLHQPVASRLCGTFRGGAAKVCIFASALLGHDVRLASSRTC